MGKLLTKLRTVARRLTSQTRADFEADLLEHLRKSPKPVTLILGDSLLAGSAIGIGDATVARCAFSGSRIADVLALVGRIRGARLWDKVAGAIVSIGVNDAQHFDGPDIKKRALYFRSALDALVRSFEEKPLVLLTITGPAKTGSLVGRFWPELVALENEEIRRAGRRAKVWDMAEIFPEALAAANIPFDDGFTDGIHLSQAGYGVWTPLVRQALEATFSGDVVQPKSRRFVGRGAASLSALAIGAMWDSLADTSVEVAKLLIG